MVSGVFHTQGSPERVRGNPGLNDTTLSGLGMRPNLGLNASTPSGLGMTLNPGLNDSSLSGLGGNPARHVPSIPNILLIEFNFIPLEHSPVFLLKRELLMVLFLPGNIVSNLRDLGKSDGKNTISALPREVGQGRARRLNPNRRASLNFFDQFGGLLNTREGGEDMDMVLDASNNDGLRPVFGEDTTDITEEFLSEFNVAQKRPPFLGREDGVNQYLRERLCHVIRMLRSI
jgi:hypothetical protein